MNVKTSCKFQTTYTSFYRVKLKYSTVGARKTHFCLEGDFKRRHINHTCSPTHTEFEEFLNVEGGWTGLAFQKSLQWRARAYWIVTVSLQPQSNLGGIMNESAARNVRTEHSSCLISLGMM